MCAKEDPLRMMAACCSDRGSASAIQECNIKAAVKQLAANVAHKHRLPSSTTSQKYLELRAWTLLLDRDAEMHQELPEVPDRAQSNRIASDKACEELRQQLRPADAIHLQQLLAKWQRCGRKLAQDRTTLYEPWVPLGPQDLSPAPKPVCFTEHQAVLSLLLALRGSCPAPLPSFTALPAVGSTAIAEVQQRAEAAVAAAGAPAGRFLGLGYGSSGQADAYAVLEVAYGDSVHAAAGTGMGHQQQQQDVTINKISSSWISAAVPATELLQYLQLDPALSTAAAAVGAQCSNDVRLRDQSCNGFDAAGLPSRHGSQVTSLVTDLAHKMQLSSGPHAGFSSSLGLQTINPASASAAVVGVSNKRNSGRSSRQRHQAATAAGYSSDVSRTAADAEAAVAAAAAVQPMVAPLMLLSSEQPGFGGMQLLGHPPNQSSFQNVLDILQSFENCNSQQAVSDSKDQNSGKAHQSQQQHEKLSPAAQRAAAEEQLLTLSCLALQGVWSAVGRLWEIAQQGGAAGNSRTVDASRWPGLSRPAAQQHLLVQVLHMAELRLRIQTFLHYFQTSRSSNPSSHNTTGNGPTAATDQAVLHTFLSAVKDVLDMHHAAIQAIQHEHQQRKQQLKRWQYQRQQQAAKNAPAAITSATAAPAMTLLQLVMLLRYMLAQLQQLADCCWCNVGYSADRDCVSGPLGLTSTGATSTQRLLTPMSFGCNAAAVGVATADNPPLTPSASSAAEDLVDGWNGNAVTSHAHPTEAAAAEARAAAATAHASALPWPAAAAAWVSLWDWDPSRWQVEQSFVQGQALAEYLYAELLHAGPQTAPLLRHLFAAAVQPLIQQIHTWAFQPGCAAAEAAAAATAITSIAAVRQNGRNRTTSLPDFGLNSSNSNVGSLTQVTITLATAAAAAAAGGGTMDLAAASTATGTNTVAEAAAAEVLLQAWTAAQDGAPECPKFFAGIQQQVAVAGLQLQLLQLLGGPGQQLAQRIGWLTELELQELREVYIDSSSSSGGSEELQSRRSSRFQQDGDMITSPAAPAGEVLGYSKPSGFSLLLGSRGAAAAAPGQAPESSSQCASSAGAAYLPFSLSIGQLKQAAAIISDYEHARQAELSSLMSRYTDAKAVAAEAQQAKLEARLQDKSIAEEAQQQLRQAAAARKDQRKRQLLLEQKEEMAAAAARRAKSRRDELAFERQLLAQHAAADHKAALQQVQHELAAAHRIGVQVPAAWQQHQQQQQQQVSVSGSAAVHIGSVISSDVQLAAAALQQQQHQENALKAEQREHLDQQQQQQEGAAGATTGPQQLGDSAAAVASNHTHTTTLIDDGVSMAQQQQQQQPAGISHKRATWGPAVFDPTPAAGKPSAAEPLAVIGSAAVAAAAALPAAGRRSNSAPRVLPGMGTVLSPDQRRPRSSDSAIGLGNPSGSGFRRTSSAGVRRWGQGSLQKAGGGSLISGALDDVDGSLGSAAAGAAGHNNPVVHSNWGSTQGRVCLISSRGRRPTSASSAAASGGSSGGARPQQQQQAAGYRRPMHSRNSSYSGSPAVAADVLVVDDGAPDVASEYQASLAAAGGGIAAAAAAASSSPVISRWQHQQQLLGFIDSRRATAAGTEQNTSIGGCRYGINSGQQQQQPDVDQSADPSESSAPLVTALEVLVINPILAQHRLTTLACWQLLLQEQQLLQKLAAMQALFFQQQGDWVDLFLEGVDKLMTPAAAGGSDALGPIGSSISDGLLAPGSRAGIAGAVGAGKQGVGVSHVAAQLVLEAALQQSCLAGDEVTQRLSVQVNSRRLLPGWGTACRSLQSHATPSNNHSASVTDQIVLHYEVPWPVSLLITKQQRQQYAQIFSVLLRLRRLKQQLTKQWAVINSRPGSSSTGSDNSSRGKNRSGAGSAVSSRRGSQAGSRPVSRADSSKPYHHHQQQSDVQGYFVPAESAAVAGDQGSQRLQQLRRWHAMALHCVSSLLATMLSELSGNLWGDFAAAITAQPVSLPDMMEAHARLLAAAQEVCLLPAFDTSSRGAGGSSDNSSGHASGSISATPTGDSKLRKSIGRLTVSMEFAVSCGSPRVAAAAVVNGTDVANLVYQLSDATWQLQQQVQQLLLGMPAYAAAAHTAPAVSSNRFADSVDLEVDEITLEVPEEGFSGSQAGGGFRVSSASRILASMLADDEIGSCWHDAKIAGWNLEGLLRTLNKHLANNRAAGVGEALAGLAARLGAMQR